MGPQRDLGFLTVPKRLRSLLLLYYYTTILLYYYTTILLYTPSPPLLPCPRLLRPRPQDDSARWAPLLILPINGSTL